MLTSVVPLMGQVGTQGSILGAVVDSSQGGTARRHRSPSPTSTPVSTQTAISDAAGNFEILALPIGPYSVDGVDAGLQDVAARSRSCSPSAIAAASRRILEVGDVTEEVSVVGGAPLLQTERSSVQTVMQMEQIRELPLSTRNPVVLVNLVPGMRFTGIGRPETRLHRAGLRHAIEPDRVPARRPERERGDGRRRHHHPQRRHDRGVQRRDLELQRGERPQPAAGDHGDQVGHATPSTAPPGSSSRTTRSTPATPSRWPNRAKLRPQPVRRDDRRPDRAQPDVLLRQLRGARRSGARRSSTRSCRSRRCCRATSRRCRRAIRDPLTEPAVPGQHHPANRISNASKFFFPYMLQPNSPDGRFRAVAPVTDDTYQYTARVDHQLTQQPAHLRPLGDELQRERLAGLLPRRHARPTRRRSTTSASTTPTR